MDERTKIGLMINENMKKLNEEDDSDKKNKLLLKIEKLKKQRKQHDEKMAVNMYNKFSKEAKQAVQIPYDAPLLVRQKFLELYQKEKDIDPKILQKALKEQQEIIEEQKRLEIRREISS